ncbi:S46 family peptidase [Caulobacter sp. KR2-114]|uniref:S46 family peptidase n=1 Tax=Caulobacter sp. KR2-114 TaxID=3400912 RepID=UPI003C0CACDA
MFKFALAAVAALLALPFASSARADEGMWTFDDFPAVQVEQSLGVRLDRPWLDHVRAASVRLTSGCSAAVVSADGLALSNQHCIMECAHDLSPPGADYVRDGFLTEARTDERKCPGVQAEVLIGITDVTAQVFAASTGKFGEDYVVAREGAMSGAERAACGGDPHLRCQVISFFRGGQFKVYKYHKYADVRLVFAPEFSAAFFGGDPDNFNFPRFAFDCAFLRLYEDGKPATTPDYLTWASGAPQAGEPVFVSGNPGASERQFTVAQLESLRDVNLPITELQRSELRGRLIQFSEQSAENRRITTDQLFGQENAFKVFYGRQLALLDPEFMAQRRKEEADLRARLAADPKLSAEVGDPWAEIERLQHAYAEQYIVWRQLEGAAGGGSELYRYARTLVRGALERAKPTTQRLPEFADSRLPLVEKTLFDKAAVEPGLEVLYLEFWLSKTREYLGADSPATVMVLGRESPEDMARRLVDGSKLADPAVRRALWSGGLPAITASSDPMIQFVLRTDPVSRAARQLWEEEVAGPTDRASERIARVRFAFNGPNIYPDATFSLRLSYGKVAGWTYKGDQVAPFTTFAGLYDRATGADPFRLSPRWEAARGKLDPAIVFNFATTNDILGGNSGSPVVDAKGQIIGDAFDGNIHSIAGDFVYDGALNRTVALSTDAITEALSKVYGRTALVKELMGR